MPLSVGLLRSGTGEVNFPIGQSCVCGEVQLSRFLNYVLDAVRRPREQLTRGQHNVRFAWDLIAHCGRQLNRHRAEGMAAELTYRTIFSLIPVVVLGLVMFRVFGGLENVQAKVEDQLYSFFGVPDIPVDYRGPITKQIDESESAIGLGEQSGSGAIDRGDVLTVDFDSVLEDQPATGDLMANEDVENNATSVEREATLKTRAGIRRTLHEMTDKVASLDFASIGVIGLLLFIYAAVALADSTEYLFNRIYDAPTKRPLHLRLAIHWSIITLGSGLLAMSLYLSGQAIDRLSGLNGVLGENGELARAVLTHMLSLLASWVLLFLLYALMPNTHVSVRAAAAGAAVSAFLWETAKYGFQVYVAEAVPYSALYGSLGLIPLFLFWIYVTWLIVLFGLILTYTLQTLNGRRLRPDDRHEELPQGDPDWMLPIMAEVAGSFQVGNSIGRQDLADQLGLSSRIVHEMETKLIEGGLLLRVTASVSEEESLTLAKPADKISVARILELAHQTKPTSTHPAWKTLANLKQAEREASAGKTLADLLTFSLKS